MLPQKKSLARLRLHTVRNFLWGAHWIRLVNPGGWKWDIRSKSEELAYIFVVEQWVN